MDRDVIGPWVNQEKLQSDGHKPQWCPFLVPFSGMEMDMEMNGEWKWMEEGHIL